MPPRASAARHMASPPGKRACQVVLSWSSQVAAENFASAPPAFCAVLSRMSPGAIELNTGVSTGCIRPQ